VPTRLARGTRLLHTAVAALVGYTLRVVPRHEARGEVGRAIFHIEHVTPGCHAYRRVRHAQKRSSSWICDTGGDIVVHLNFQTR
jgi:hypothetical protein